MQGTVEEPLEGLSSQDFHPHHPYPVQSPHCLVSRFISKLQNLNRNNVKEKAQMRKTEFGAGEAVRRPVALPSPKGVATGLTEVNRTGFWVRMELCRFMKKARGSGTPAGVIRGLRREVLRSLPLQQTVREVVQPLGSLVALRWRTSFQPGWRCSRPAAQPPTHSSVVESYGTLNDD